MDRVRTFVTLLLLASLAGATAPLCRCLPESAQAPAQAGHECCAPHTAPSLRAATCCPTAPGALTDAPTPAAPPALAGPVLAVDATQPSVACGAAATPSSPSPPAPARSSSILRV